MLDYSSNPITQIYTTSYPLYEVAAINAARISKICRSRLEHIRSQMCAALATLSNRPITCINLLITALIRFTIGQILSKPNAVKPISFILDSALTCLILAIRYNHLYPLHPPIQQQLMCINMKLDLFTTLSLLYLLVVTAVNCQILGGTLAANSSSLSFNYTLASQANSAGIVFKIMNFNYSNLVIVADNQPIPSLNMTPQALSTYYLQNNSILQQMDIPRAIAGYNQLVNLRFPDNTTLYFTVYNLDPPNSSTGNKSFTVEITQYDDFNVLCYQCPGGSRLTSQGSCQCSPCQTDNYGLACQFYQKPLIQHESYNVSFYKAGNLYFRIVNPPPTIVLSFVEMTNTNSTTLYIQYEAVTGGIAGYLNTYYQNNQPYSYQVTGTVRNISIQTKGKSLSLTITSRQQVSANLNIGYDLFAQSGNAVGMIVGLGLGIPIFIIIILTVVFCLVCRRRGPNNTSTNALVNQYQLTREQIERYLPQVPATLVLSNPNNLNQSKTNLQRQASQEEKADNPHNQCCICLTEFTQDQKVRVGYCRHFFHSKCLVGWFARNQNCPYCRREFDYNKTLEAYRKIKGQGPDLDGEKLAQAILRQEKEEPESQSDKKQQSKIEIQIGQQLQNQDPSIPEQEQRQQGQGRYHPPLSIPGVALITASLGELQGEREVDQQA